MTSPQSETSCLSQWSDSDTVFEDVYEMFEVIGKWVDRLTTYKDITKFNANIVA